MSDSRLIHMHVTSSNIASIAHDLQTNTLHVKFKNGSAYEYSDVDADAFQNLLSAQSVGSHLHQHIKPHHCVRKVSGETEMSWENAELTLLWNQEHEQWYATFSIGDRTKSFFVEHPMDDKPGAEAKAREYLKTKGAVTPVSETPED